MRHRISRRGSQARRRFSFFFFFPFCFSCCFFFPPLFVSFDSSFSIHSRARRPLIESAPSPLAVSAARVHPDRIVSRRRRRGGVRQQRQSAGEQRGAQRNRSEQGPERGHSRGTEGNGHPEIQVRFSARSRAPLPPTPPAFLPRTRNFSLCVCIFRAIRFPDYGIGKSRASRATSYR